MERMEKNLPEGTEFVTMMSSNDFLFASIHNVVETLIIAIILVILVVYFFLQDLKSTLIPSISIIVSLVGTFACLVAAGFSLNILTLFALVLAIGTVVDDAIVVVEAVEMAAVTTASHRSRKSEFFSMGISVSDTISSPSDTSSWKSQKAHHLPPLPTNRQNGRYSSTDTSTRSGPRCRSR
jgi:multidrug efflux pump subunit AcrB